MKPKERLTNLRVEIDDLLTEADAIIDQVTADERDLSAEEQARVDEILGSKETEGLVDGLKAKVEWWEQVEAKRKAGNDPHQLKTTWGTCPTGDSQTPVIHATAQRDSTRFIKGTRNGLGAEERAYRFGMLGLHMLAQQLPHRGYDFPRAAEFVAQNIQMAAHGSVGGSGFQFGIPEEFRADVINLKESRGVASRLFERVPMMRDTITTPRRLTGMTTYAKAEGAAGTESNMTMDDVRLRAETFITLGRINKETNEDAAINFGDLLAREIAYSQADKEDECGFNGDGTSTYGGITGIRTALVGSAGLKTQGTGNTWGAIVLQDFHDTISLLPDYGDSADTVWVTSRTFYYSVMHPLIVALGGVSAMEGSQGERRPRPIFLGYPVEFSQVFPSATAVDSVVASLGDHSVGAMHGDRRDLTIEFDDTVVIGGQSVWEREQIAVKGVARWDMNVHSAGDASNAGAICGLTTGS